MFQTGGKPSTWFPPVGLVELYLPSNRALYKINSINKYLTNLMAGCQAAGGLVARIARWLAAGWLAAWLADRLAAWLGYRLLAGSLAG